MTCSCCFVVWYCPQAIVLNNFDFTFATSPEDVGMKTGATIHTMNGLNMNVRKLSKEAEATGNGWMVGEAALETGPE